jgi:hypothetical protein
MKKKYSAGAVIACIAGVLALVGAIAYLINAKTNYYAKMGVDTTIVVCLCAAAVLSAVRLFLSKPGFADILPVAASVLATAGLMFLVNARVNNLAAVFTFENNAANMADTTSCIVAIAASALAVILTVVSAFSDTVKEA